MALYGNTGVKAAWNYSSSGGQVISNDSNSTFSETGEINLEAGSYLLFVCYMPSMSSGEYPNNDEDPHEIAYKLGSSWQTSTIEAPETNPQTHTKTSSSLWIESSTSAMTIRFGVRKGGSDGDAGGTRGRLHWRVTKIAEYA